MSAEEWHGEGWSAEECDGEKSAENWGGVPRRTTEWEGVNWRADGCD